MRLARAQFRLTKLFRLAAVGWEMALVARHANAAVEFTDPLPLGPLEAKLLADAADGRFQNFTLIAAALGASGVAEGEQLGPYHKGYLAWLVRAREACSPLDPPAMRAQKIFELMHREIL